MTFNVFTRVTLLGRLLKLKTMMFRVIKSHNVQRLCTKFTKADDLNKNRRLSSQ